MAEPMQATIEQWTDEQLARAGVELADRLYQLKIMEDEEAERRKAWKEEHEEALSDLAALRNQIRAQRFAAEESDS